MVRVVRVVRVVRMDGWMDERMMYVGMRDA